MDKSRRAFTASGLAIASSVLLAGKTSAEPSKPAAGGADSAKAAAFVKKVGIQYPVCNAVFDGPGVPELAGAVSEAGGLGGMGFTWLPEDVARDYVKRTKALTKKPFAIGYVLEFEPRTLGIALEAGAPVVQFSWGTPTAAQVAFVRSFGAKVGMQICNLTGALQAFDLGVDYISCQGQEAGGHVQAQSSWRETLGPIIARAGDTPVLVAGGLADGKALREALSLGASGGVFGTRFVATRESAAYPEYKKRLVDGTPSETSLTVCFDGGWNNALHRVLRNATLDNWAAAGAKSAGKRPGEGDIVARLGSREFPRYLTPPPSVGMTGSPMDMPLYSGLGVGSIHDIPAAGDLVRRIWGECIGTTV